MKTFALVLALLIPVSFAAGQEAPGNTAPPVLQKPYEVLRDFFNYYATAGFDYDSNGQYLLGGLQSGSAEGVSVGGGVSGVHNWASASFSLSYRGTYSDYFGNFGHANNQSLFASYQKRFKRWSLVLGESGGILFEQGAVYGGEGADLVNPNTIVQANPYSTEVKFENTSVGASYQQTYRLSYSFSGGYMIDRYNYQYAVGFNDVSGSAAVNYRVTRATTVSGTYAHSVYQYEGGLGSNQVDNIFLTVAHNFQNHVSVSASAGGTRASGSGAAIYPITAILNGVPETVYARVHYQTTNYLPFFAVTASKQYHHTDIFFSGSESVTPGNGEYLTTRSLGFNGIANQQFRRSDISVGGYYSRLSGVVNAGGSGLSQMRGLDASYSYNIFRHVGLTARYDLLDYGNYGGLHSKPDNHLTLGVYFESKDIPLGLY